MPKQILLLTAALLVSSYGNVHGQLVQVRNGYVKAPFVRVQKNLDGSTFVRAPFVSVNAPYHDHHFDHGHPHSAAVPRAYHHMPYPELCDSVCRSTNHLDAQLKSFPTGGYWRKYLATAELRTLLAKDAVHDERTRQRLQEILQTYDAVVQTPELTAIAELYNFQTVHIALTHAAMPVEVRIRYELSDAAVELEASLQRLKNGAQWIDYLALSLPSDPKQHPSTESLKAALQRFDSFGDDDAITKLPGFQRTRDTLVAYLNALQPNGEPVVAPEPLPEPEVVEQAE